MMTYRRGSVVLVRFPNSDQVTFKKRPALIVQDSAVAQDLNQLVAAEITSSSAVSPGPTRIKVEKDTVHGRRMSLLVDSMIVLDNLATIPMKAIEKNIGSCGLMGDVDSALALTLGLRLAASAA